MELPDLEEMAVKKMKLFLLIAFELGRRHELTATAQMLKEVNNDVQSLSTETTPSPEAPEASE